MDSTLYRGSWCIVAVGVLEMLTPCIDTVCGQMNIFVFVRVCVCLYVCTCVIDSIVYRRS